MAVTIGVDVGGTKVAAGLVADDGRILAKTRRETPAASNEATLAIIGEVIQELAALPDGAAVDAVGIGAPGFVDERRATVLIAPNIASWRQEPLAERVRELTGLATVVENDANAAAWGEAAFGAGSGAAYLVCVTVGTGIGTGIVLDGRLYRGRWGVAAEAGHYRVVPGGRRCGCGNRGCWEQYASGKALTREARRLAFADEAGASLLLSLGDGTPQGIKGKHVTAAAIAGDPVAAAAFANGGRWLGQGMADLAAVLDPEVFVVGGGVSEADDLLLGPARAAYAEALSGAGYRPLADIRAATLGNDAGIVGAADLARR